MLLGYTRVSKGEVQETALRTTGGRTTAHRTHLWRTLGPLRTALDAQSAPSGRRGGRVGRGVVA
jgi:hypothetical protein